MQSTHTHVVGVTNRKGGVGKSTLSCLLVHQASAAGQRTLLVDADVDQGDASLWMLPGQVTADTQESGKVYHARDQLDVVWITEADEMPTLSGYDLVVLDGRPSGIVSALVVGLSDMLIVPYTDQTGRRHAQEIVRLAADLQGKWVPVYITQVQLAEPHSRRQAAQKGLGKLVGYDRALHSHRWAQARVQLYTAVREALDKLDGGRGEVAHAHAV